MRVTYLLFLSVLSLSGCSQHQALEQAIEEYHARLARVLEQPQLTPTFTATLGFDSRQSYYVSPKSISINVREFVNLPNCAIGPLIAQRNTGLGKTQLPSQRYVYEVELLAVLQECLATNPSSMVSARLSEALSVKQQQLPSAYANLVTASEETWLALNQSNGFISGDGSDGLNQTVAGWRYLLDVSVLPSAEGQTTTLDSTELERALKDLKDTRLLARLWRSEQLIVEWFGVSNPWLNEQLKQFSCDSPSNEEQAKILRNVYMLFFAEKIQPIASQMNHYHYQLTPLLEQLVDTSAFPMAWRGSIQRNVNQHHSYRESMKTHIEIWQAFFKRCGLSPLKAS